jgi:hypothetical protein
VSASNALHDDLSSSRAKDEAAEAIHVVIGHWLSVDVGYDIADLKVLRSWRIGYQRRHKERPSPVVDMNPNATPHPNEEQTN